MTRLVFCLLAGGLLLGCPGPDDTGADDTGPTVVFEGPDIAHTVPDDIGEGVDVLISAKVTDGDGVGDVRTYYRTLGSPVWEVLAMTEGEGEAENTFTATIPGSAVVAPGLQYYLRAEDLSELESVSYLPDEGQQGPFEVTIAPRGLAVPFFEDFDASSGPLGLYDLGWDEHAYGFEGYPWTVATTRSSSAPWSVGHRAGVSGLPAMDDWLVSPPLDLSDQTEVQVTWREWGNDTSLANHGLYLSTGSADPADDGFALVTALDAPPEDAWGDSQVVDLSAWGGEQLVYLAWRYQGEFADAWWIDDVAVEALQPAIRFLDLANTEPVDPGSQVTVTVSFENASPKASEDFTVTASTDAANGTFSEPVMVGGIAGLDGGEAAFTLDIDEAFPDDSLLPFTVTAELADESTASWDLELVVGTLPTAAIEITPDALGFVQGWLGVGDPDDPTIEFPAFSRSLGATTELEVDLTGYGAHLPPVAGPGRWYLRVVGAQAGSVDAFEIHYADQTFASLDVGDYPADISTVFYLPRPPQPVLVSDEVDPTPAPDTQVTWTVTLRNDGAASVGETTLDVTTADPEVTVTDVSPSVLAADGWANAQEVTVDVTLDLSASKIDSRPVPLSLEVTDDLETVSVGASLEVPWPVLHVTGVVVDDGAGDDDGTLDPGESAVLTVELTNQGGKQAFDVSCTLSTAGGTGAATVDDSLGLYGLLSVGETDGDTFGLTVTSGVAGDTLDLSLACTDDTANAFQTGFTMILGEAPWILLSPVDDPIGDHLGGDFDLVNGRYRSDGTTLELVLQSAEPFEPTTAFVESWMFQQGSEYVMYQLVVQGRSDGAGGVEFDGRLRGCDLFFNSRCYSFTRIANPTASVESSTEIRVEIDLDVMGLVVDSLDAAYGAGFCGGQTLYCDHLPDGWGSGVSGLNTFRFLSLDVGPPGR